VLFPNRVYTPLVQSFDLVAIGRLQGRKHPSYVAQLQLVGSVRGEATYLNVVTKAKLQGL
jgi:hypothetical protein